MINKLFEDIITGNNIRQNLSELRKILKNGTENDIIKTAILNSQDIFIKLFSNSDAKTRKNAALLIGDLAIDEFAETLFKQYKSEETLFVKSSYLTALLNLNCKQFLPEFKIALDLLNTTEITAENKKHIQEEIKELSELILKIEGLKPHTFTGYNKNFDCILLTNRLHSEITKNQIFNGDVSEFKAGLRVKTNDIKELLDIRTYSELLLIIPELTVLPAEPLDIAKVIAKSKLLTFLHSIHKETNPFYFRVELKSRMPLDKKSAFIKRLSADITQLTNRQLINSASNYELEIRLIENKSHTYNVLLKLYTLPNSRFEYRYKAINTSIKPDTAALLVKLASDYMIDDAKVLDPFCGTATMLIERQMQIKANTSYGIDISEKAILAAKENTQQAGQIIHFINRDFFTFKHEYLFDEIFTNMPFFMGDTRKEELHKIYKDFFDTAHKFLTDKGTVILYSHNPEFVELLANHCGYKILKRILIMDNINSKLFVLKYIN